MLIGSTWAITLPRNPAWEGRNGTEWASIFVPIDLLLEAKQGVKPSANTSFLLTSMPRSEENQILSVNILLLALYVMEGILLPIDA